MNLDRYVSQNFEQALAARVASMDWFEFLEIPRAQELVQWGADDVVETPCETVLEFFRTDRRAAQLLRNHLGPKLAQLLQYESIEETEDESKFVRPDRR